LYRTPSCMSVVTETLLWFYIILAVKDIFLMQTFHGLMHSNRAMYELHRTHHEVRRNSTFQLAFHADAFNLFLEDAGAPLLLAALLNLCGFGEVRIPIYSLHLLALFDGGIHSVNPYTVLFWNPIADYFMNANVTHGIHHSRGSKHITTVPIHHLFSSGARKRDEHEYDSLMKTSLFEETQTSYNSRAID
jgi:sterol desaturase/sphingolipid hydroxylase (fatty acid hydroxylase superfamily)